MKSKILAAISGLALMATAGGALADGDLNIYNWGNYTNPDMIKKFEDTYKVKVTITDYDSNDAALAKIRQGGHGFDIAVPSGNFLPIWINEGLALEVRPDQMENFKHMDERWKNPPYDPGRHFSVPWQWGTFGVIVNTKMYGGDIDSWSIVFDPPAELQGKINVVPEMGDMMFAAIKYNGGSKCSGDLEILKKARQSLLDAKKYWVSMEYSTIEKMVKGDFAATSDWNGSALRMRLQDPNIKYGYPKEGTFIWADTVVVLKDAKNVENAKLFMNFIMDPENAAMISSFARYANGIAGSEAFMPEDMKTAPEIVVPQSMDGKLEYSVACPADVEALYTKIWTELMK